MGALKRGKAMNEELMEEKSSAVPALVLGIIGLIIAMVGGCLFGIIGGIAGAVLGLLAIILGARAKKVTDGTKGTPGIVFGAISMVVAILCMVVFFSFPATLQKTAEEKGLPTVAKYAGNFKFGVLGMAISVDPADLDAMQKEVEKLN